MQNTATHTADHRPRLLEWDECALADVRAAQLLKDGFADDEAQARELAYEDSDWFHAAFEDFLADLWQMLTEISPEGVFHVEGRDIGWRRLSGTAEIQPGCARGFIARVFPKTTEWSFHGTYHPAKRRLAYRLSHHDAPTGEFHIVTTGNPDLIG